MKTHPKIAAILKRNDLSKEYRQAVEEANKAHKLSRAHSPSAKHAPTKREVLALSHASLLISGIEKVCGMEPDVWMLRLIRDYEKAPVQHTSGMEAFYERQRTCEHEWQRGQGGTFCKHCGVVD